MANQLYHQLELPSFLLHRTMHFLHNISPIYGNTNHCPLVTKNSITTSLFPRWLLPSDLFLLSRNMPSIWLPSAANSFTLMPFLCASHYKLNMCVYIHNTDLSYVLCSALLKIRNWKYKILNYKINMQTEEPWSYM